MIKKTIQRNHMFAIFALLFFLSFFFIAYPEYRFEGYGILCLKYCFLLCYLNLLSDENNCKTYKIAKYILHSIYMFCLFYMNFHELFIAFLSNNFFVSVHVKTESIGSRQHSFKLDAAGFDRLRNMLMKPCM